MTNVISLLRFCALYAMVGIIAGCGGGASSQTASTSSTASAAASYLESDPYPLTGDQPSHFLVSCDGATPVDSPAALNTSGARYLYFSLSGLNAGSHVCSVVAVDASGLQSSAVSDSFTLTVGEPTL